MLKLYVVTPQMGNVVGTCEEAESFDQAEKMLTAAQARVRDLGYSTAKVRPYIVQHGKAKS